MRYCGKIRYSQVGHTDDNIIRRMRFTCWITKATATLRIRNTLLFHGNNGYANASQCNARTLPVLSKVNADSVCSNQTSFKRLTAPVAVSLVRSINYCSKSESRQI